jgi:hypothetical protein
MRNKKNYESISNHMLEIHILFVTFFTMLAFFISILNKILLDTILRLVFVLENAQIVRAN